MKSGYTHIIAVLDRSGSMRSVLDSTINGFNTFLKEQKAASGEATLTLVQFDDQYETLYFAEPIAEIPDLNSNTFVPRGYTALYDAVGKTVDLTGKWLAEKSEDERPERVIVVILTDGGENASKKFSAEQILDAVRHQEEKYGWTFMFIGANIDSFATSQALGFSAQNTINFVASAVGTDEAFKSMSKGLTLARGVDYATYNTTLRSGGLFDAEDYEAQTKLGADNTKRGTVTV